MPIAICAECRLPVPDSFHDFEKACECKDYVSYAKKRGRELIFPKNYKWLK